MMDIYPIIVSGSSIVAHVVVSLTGNLAVASNVRLEPGNVAMSLLLRMSGTRSDEIWRNTLGRSFTVANAGTRWV